MTLIYRVTLIKLKFRGKKTGHLFGTVFNILNIYMMSFSCGLFFKCYSRYKDEHMTMWVGAVHLLVWLHLLNYEIDLSSSICAFFGLFLFYFFLFVNLYITLEKITNSQQNSTSKSMAIFSFDEKTNHSPKINSKKIIIKHYILYYLYIYGIFNAIILDITI